MTWGLGLDFKYIVSHVFPGILPTYMVMCQIPAIGQILKWNASTWILFLFVCIVFGILIDTVRHSIELVINCCLNSVYCRKRIFVKKNGKKVHIFPLALDYEIPDDKFDHVAEIRSLNYPYWEFHSNMVLSLLFSTFFPGTLPPLLLPWWAWMLIFMLMAFSVRMWTQIRIKEFEKRDDNAWISTTKVE